MILKSLDQNALNFYTDHKPIILYKKTLSESKYIDFKHFK